MKLKGLISSNARIYEAYAYEVLGNFSQYDAYKNDLDKEKFVEALGYYEKSLDVATVNNNPEGINRMKTTITAVRSDIGELKLTSEPEYLEQIKELYEVEAGKNETSASTIQCGIQYAKALKKYHHGVQSERLFQKLLKVCKRIYGSHHKLTKQVRSTKNEGSNVWMTSEGNGECYVFMHYDGSFEKFVGYDKNDKTKETEDGSLLPVQSLSIDEVILDKGTIVFSSPNPIAHNDDPNQFVLGDISIWQLRKGKVTTRDDINTKPTELNSQDLKLGDVQSFDPETKCYIVHWEDESIETCSVPRGRVFIPLCICTACIESNAQFTAPPKCRT